MILAVLLACAPAPLPAAPDAPVYVESADIASGGSTRLHTPVGASVELGDRGLVVAPAGEAVWTVSGPDGSYIITVTPAGGAPIRVFLDIGVDGPKAGELQDLASVPPAPPPLWPWVVAGGLAGVLAVGGGWWAYQRLRPPPPPPVPDPPHVVAQRAWAALRARTDLPPEAVARQMSEIFRGWVDAAWGFPATRRTTREILDNLAGSFTAIELDAARRLLGATDLVKFAERTEHADLFERLDRDFHLLVQPIGRGARV